MDPAPRLKGCTMNEEKDSVTEGHWFDIGSLSCRCSECGCKNNKETKYCPNCGARMNVKGR